MNKEDIVFCSDCINWGSLHNKIGYFGCHIECLNCVCGCCDCYDPEFGKRFTDRPKYIKSITGFLQY